MHQIWAVINKGTANQVERHTAPIVVGNAAANRYHLDADVTLKGEADSLQ